MAISNLAKELLNDMNKTIEELSNKELLREAKGISQHRQATDVVKLSFHGKNDASSILYDKHITSKEMIDTLLKGHQYTILLYDKSLIQAEFIVEENTVIKERLVFIKKHNKIWDIKEIEEHEILDEDWFAEEFGVPIMIRIDYAPTDQIEGAHSATHLTISNHISCRIPMKGIVTFSEFIRFILLHFYDIQLELPVFHSNTEDTITELEKQMIHMNWS